MEVFSRRVSTAGAAFGSFRRRFQPFHVPDGGKGGIVHVGEQLLYCPHRGKHSGLEAPLLPAVHLPGVFAHSGAAGVFQMPACAAQFVAEGFHLFNALFGIIQRAADILLNRFQRFMDAHSGNRLIQRGNAGPLKTLHSIGGALHDLFAQAVQLFLPDEPR